MGRQLLAALLLVALALVARAGDSRADRVTPAKRVKTRATVRAKPKAGAKSVGTLARGAYAKLVRALPGWVEVELDDGTRGFIAKGYAAVVPDPPPPPPDGALRVTFIDVGEGDAILLQVGSVDLLVDAGPPAAWDENLRAGLQAVDGPLEAFFLTHPHADHFGSAANVLGAFEVKTVYTTGERRGPPRDKKRLRDWQAFEQAVGDEGLTPTSLAAGDELEPAPGLTLRVLAAGGQFKDTAEGSDINNDSLVLMVEYGGRRVLLTGDIEDAADKELVKRWCENGEPARCPALRADVIKVPHHGSDHFAPVLYDAVQPAAAVISAGYNDMQHCLPRAVTVDAIVERGIQLVSTSGEDDENVVLTIEKTGAMSWSIPTHDVFAWRVAGKRCTGRLSPQAKAP